MKQEQPFEIGQRATVCAEVWTGYTELFTRGKVIHDPFPGNCNSKKLIRELFLKPIEGIIIGYTWRATGILGGTRNPRRYTDDDPLHLVEDKHHKVWLVARKLRHEKPIAALETDIKIVFDDQSPIAL